MAYSALHNAVKIKISAFLFVLLFALLLLMATLSFFLLP